MRETEHRKEEELMESTLKSRTFYEEFSMACAKSIIADFVFRGKCPDGHHNCMKKIQPEDVFQGSMDLLESLKKK